MAFQPGTTFANRYTLERELGRGATATVWLALDATSGDRVALKILRSELAEGTERDHFLREINRTAAFSHPRILRVLDAGSSGDTLYFALPYMPEGTLRRRLIQQRQLPIADALTIAQALADALAHAHAQGFVHRDVKPENILFRDGAAYLTDFGICRALERSLDESSTSRALVRGTPAYMSPEQASGEEDYDGRSDIFSLGCVIYEMLAGVPAFTGPTPQIVLAQRFAHAPREIRVFRASVPAALEAAVNKCLQIAPADRYRDARELVVALATIDPDSAPSPSREHMVVGTGENASRGRRKADRWQRGLVPVLSIAVAAVALGVAVTTWSGPGKPPVVVPDTTWVAVFPLERRGKPAMEPVHFLDDDLLRNGLTQWESGGVSLVDQFQVQDALRQLGDPPTVAEAAAIAQRLGAGRFVRGQLTAYQDSTVAQLALYEVGRPRALSQTKVRVPPALDEATDAYGRAAWSLLMRGAAVDRAALEYMPRRSFLAAQAFSRARTALDAWDLARADSQFELALSFEREDAHSLFWLAQVRAWRDRPVETWSGFAQRATRADTLLPGRDRALAFALAALATSRFADACQIYDSLSRRNPRDFAPWYGLGQCRVMDRVVVRDTVASPSGWRFRSSRHAALIAYEKAFALLPTVHRGYEGSAFEGLRQLLFLSNDVVTGYSLPDSARFPARPAWRGDTLALIPVPWAVATSGAPGAVPAGFTEALVQQRRRFRAIAAGWSAALPGSSEAKEAVAVALDLLGHPAAIDTIRLARQLATDPQRRLSLATSEVRLRLRFGLPDRPESLTLARQLADSVLRNTGEVGTREAEQLAILAVIRGHCPSARRYVRASIPAKGYFGISPDLLGDSQELLVRAAMRCRPIARPDEYRALAARVSSFGASAPAPPGGVLDAVLLLRPVLFSARDDGELLERLRGSVGSVHVLAARAVLARDPGEARRLLASAERQGPEDPPRTPDMALVGAELWVAVGDTARALLWIDEALSSARQLDLSVLGDVANVAAVIRLARWRAEFAEAARDRITARRWQRALEAMELWDEPSSGG